MLFTRELPLASIIRLCQILRHSLGAGVNVVTIFHQLGKRGPRPLRASARRVEEVLSKGHKLTTALEREGDAYPSLMLALVSVGEETGHVPEICGQLERYYLLVQQLRRQFRSRIMLPVIQFFLAILVITGMLYLIGMINKARGTDIFGISGPETAFRFLGWTWAAIVFLVGSYFILRQALHKQAFLDRLLLWVPGVGGCMEAFALARFTMALGLTMDSAMKIESCLALSLRATGNASYAGEAEAIAAALTKGVSLAAALGQTGRFPGDLIEVVAVAEVGGRVPEIMRQQTQHYFDLAERRLRRLTRTATSAVWLLYAGLMIVAIFRIARLYFQALGK
jgi:type IV pilus assembly protein PilC